MTNPRQPFELIYDPEVAQHLAKIERKYHSLIRHTIEQQLTCEPEVETHNRKPLLRPAELSATWEIRSGPGNPFRVFYEADHTDSEVHILAIGFPAGSRLLIGGEEFEL